MRIRVFQVFVFALFVGTTFLHASVDTAALKSTLSKLGPSVSFSLRSLAGKEIAEVNGKSALTPASIAKLVSMACVLEALGPEFQFETPWGVSGELEGGILSGNLVVQASGDPSFVIEDAKVLVELLHDVYGIQEIKGRLVYDLSFFGKANLSLGEDFSGDVGRSFATDLTPFAFNFNSFGIWVVPDAIKPQVKIFPADAVDVKIQSQVHASKGKSQEISLDFNSKEQLLKVSGHIGEEAQAKVIYRAVDDVYSSFAKLFARLWKETGGSWTTPAYDFSPTRVAMKKIHIHQSRPLGRLVLDINKLSTNFAAELVTLAAAAHKYGTPVTFEKEQKFLSECVWNFGVPKDSIVMTNASGLSRQTKIAASSLSQVLSSLKEESFYPEYLSSLSLLGRDGTTRSRLTEYAGRARLKTGSIKDVRSIAGYVMPVGQEAMSFALLMNSSKLSEEKMTSIENEVLEILLKAKK